MLSHTRQLTGLCLLGLVAPVAMAEQAATSPGVNAQYLLQVFLGLGFVLMLIFAIAWFVRRFGQGGLMGNNQMRIVSSLPLGTRERIALVDVGGKQLLLGVTAQTITALHSFDEPLPDPKTQRDSSEFSKKIREIITRGNP